MHNEQKFEPAQTQLYTSLLHLFSKAGSGKVWPVSLRLQNEELCKQVGLSLNALKPARTVLISRGLIGFDGEAKGRGVHPEYWLFDEHGQTKRLSKSDTLNPEKVSKSDTFKLKGCQNLTVFIAKRCQILTPTLYISNIKETFLLSQKRVCELLRGLAVEAKKNEVVDVVAEEVIPQTPIRPGRGDPFTRRSDSEACNVAFSVWYQAYDYDVGKEHARTAWLELTDQERKLAIDHTPHYVAARPQKRYRGYPLTYLSEKRFNDEITDYGNPTPDNRRNGRRRGDQESDTGTELDRLIDGYYST